MNLQTSDPLRAAARNHPRFRLPANAPLAAAKVVNAIITALMVVAFAIIGSGFWQRISSGRK